MLAAHARLRRRDEFTRAVRGGRRAGRGSLVVHLVVPDVRPHARPDLPPDHALPGLTLAEALISPGPPRAGFVVSRAVGNSVVRNRVVRRLRHLVRDRLPALPPGSQLVVRALPPAATRSSDLLGRDLDDALRRLGHDPGSAS